jgi:predicted AAA+ superfamily ATPase
MTYRPRHAADAVRAALADTRVVIVNGARQVGKTTVVHALVGGIVGARERRLDLPAEMSAARSDPVAFVDHAGLLVIDEVQRAPELMLPIKARVDADPRPGQFLLTGSARVMGLRGLPDALVGRSETVELWPFSQGELDGLSDGFVDAAFADRPVLATAGEATKLDYLERSVRGGFPEAVRREPGRRARFFDSYVNDLIDRDVTQLAEIQRRAELLRLLSLLAGRMATPLVSANLASELGIDVKTVDRYLGLLEEVFLVKRVPPWANSATARATRSRKLLFVDSGLGARLAGFVPARAERDPAMAGRVLENFVIGEIARQLTWSSTSAQLFHYRTRDGEEVDAVLEALDRRVVGVEVKASRTVTADDFRRLVHLRTKAAELFHVGVVLYCGTDVLSFGDRLLAAPIDALWRTPPLAGG